MVAFLLPLLRGLFDRELQGGGWCWDVPSCVDRCAAAIANNARLAWPDDECCIVGPVALIEECKFVALQQNAPDDFDLIIGKRETDAAMLAAAKSDQCIGSTAVLLARRRKAGGIACSLLGKKIRYTPADLLACLNKARVEAAA